MSTMLQAALTYCRPNGCRPPLRIFPCYPRTKVPMIEDWQNLATSDEETIKEWWRREPDANIGMLCDGFYVVDVDEHDEAVSGHDSLHDLEKQNGPLPDTWINMTPTGGEHHIMSCSDPRLRNGANIWPGLDGRTTGGLIILPPSIHPTGGRYEWEAGHMPHETPLAPLPDLWRDFILSKQSERSEKKEVPETIQEGERNDTLFRTGCSLREKGLTEAEIYASLSEMNKGRCDPPLREDELRAIAASAARYERGSPKGTIRDSRPASSSQFLSCFKTLDTIEEEEPRWFSIDRLAEGQINTLASDGGIGKTSIAVDIAANRSAGRPCIFDPPGFQCGPQLIAFLSTEDSVKKKLKRKLREAGGNMSNIIVPDFSEDKDGLLRDFKFGSEQMTQFVRHYKPALCIFDPLQGFIPPLVNMGSRNAMRDCMAPLVSLGEETGTTFLILMHTNKRKAAWGRDRIADSADLWDISRSVFMAGYTEEQGIRYLSQEKSNYGPLQETILFTIDGAGAVRTTGTSWKRDREYQQEAIENTSGPKREDCKGWILRKLDDLGGSMPVKELDSQARTEGYSPSIIRRAKDDLKRDAEIEYFQTGSVRERVWHVRRIALPEGWSPSDT